MRELLNDAFSVAISSRPSLARWGIDVILDPVSLPSPQLESFGEEEDDTRRTGTLSPPAGGTLLELASRLDLPLHDVADLVRGAGLPCPDDFVDGDSEESLRRLVGIVPNMPLREESAPFSSLEVAHSLPTGKRAASRLMGKLLRTDGSAGGMPRFRTCMAMALPTPRRWSRKELVDRLIRSKILPPKLNEGQQHVSINPRRLREVDTIVKGVYRDEELFEGL